MLDLALDYSKITQKSDACGPRLCGLNLQPALLTGKFMALNLDPNLDPHNSKCQVNLMVLGHRSFLVKPASRIVSVLG